jgi:hypothetical protein
MDRNVRDELIERVKYGELTPAEAEAEAKRLNLPALEYQPDPKDFDPAKEAQWSLTMAVAWIAYRKIKMVREWWDKYRRECWDWHWRKWRVGPDGDIHEGWFLEQRHHPTLALMGIASALYDRCDRDPKYSMTVAEAKTALWTALQTDCFTASGVEQSCGRRVPIPALSWYQLRYVEQNDRDEVRPDTLFVREEDRYRDVLVPSANIRTIWPSRPIVGMELPPLMHPIGEGHMPLFCAARWIASQGGAKDFDFEDSAIWQTAYDELLASIASGKLTVIGTRNGEREPVPGYHFADCQVDYPFGSAPLNLLLSDTLYLRSYAYSDDEHWRRGYDDALLNRHGERWSRLLIPKNEVRARWPFGAVEPTRTGLPGRPSSKHLILQELRYRAGKGELEATLRAQVDALVAWLVKAHPTQPQPTAKTIENAIRSAYRELAGTK